MLETDGDMMGRVKIDMIAAQKLWSQRISG